MTNTLTLIAALFYNLVWAGFYLWLDKLENSNRSRRETVILFCILFCCGLIPISLLSLMYTATQSSGGY